MTQSITQQRLRIRFGKYGALRFVGHLDLVKSWERVLRRAQVPLEYSRGFNAHPRFQFAAALPVGGTSDCEYLDAWITEPLVPDEWGERLVAASPAALPTTSVIEVPIKSPALPTLVTSAEYRITPLDDSISLEALYERAHELLAAETLQRIRNKKPYDLRPLLLDFRLVEDGIIAWVKAGEQANARADELLDALGLELAQAHLHRMWLYLGDEPQEKGRV